MILPSNKKFGYFFTLVFTIFSAYLFYLNIFLIGYIFLSIAIIFLVITSVNSYLLLPLNKLWMCFGTMLGRVISPIVLGIIFFGLFTPYGIVMRIMKRDALYLKKTKNKSYWLARSQQAPQNNFKQQF